MHSRSALAWIFFELTRKAEREAVIDSARENLQVTAILILVSFNEIFHKQAPTTRSLTIKAPNN